MSQQTLDDQLHELRLSAFRTALREQQANPQYTDLSFEDRLSLLVDAECSQRRENRVKRNIRAAGFPMTAALEDLDFAPHADWNAALSWSWGSATGLPAARISWFLARPGVESRSWLPPLALRPRVWGSPCATTAPPACCTPSPLPARMVRSPRCCVLWPKPTCWSSMIGCAMPFLSRMRRTSWRCWTTASVTPPP